MQVSSTHRTPGPYPVDLDRTSPARVGGTRLRPAADRRVQGEWQGPVQIRDPLADLDDYGAVDDFSADYVDDPDVARAMHDLSAHYHEQGMGVSTSLREKVAGLADAMGISIEEGMRNHRNLAQALGQSRLPGDRPPPPVDLEGYWASGTQLGTGYLIGRAIGTNAVWGSLADTAAGLTGPGADGLFLSERTFARSPADGFWGGVRNALATVGNFFADVVGDHAKIHDAAGKIRTLFGVGPGYSYAPGALPPGTNFTTGQVSGTLYSLGRKIEGTVGRVASGTWDAVADFASDAAGVARDLGRSVADTAGYIGNSIADMARDAWDGVKDTLGFGDDDNDSDDRNRDSTSDRASGTASSPDPQSDGADVRDSGSF